MYAEAKEFSKILMGEAVSITVYILNWCATKNLKNKVLEDVWSSNQPSVSRLKLFGSMCYKHVPDARRRKIGTAETKKRKLYFC